MVARTPAPRTSTPSWSSRRWAFADGVGTPDPNP